jgi:hypothetical protein
MQTSKSGRSEAGTPSGRLTDALRPNQPLTMGLRRPTLAASRL